MKVQVRETYPCGTTLDRATYYLPWIGIGYSPNPKVKRAKKSGCPRHGWRCKPSAPEAACVCWAKPCRCVRGDGLP